MVPTVPYVKFAFDKAYQYIQSNDVTLDSDLTSNMYTGILLSLVTSF